MVETTIDAAETEQGIGMDEQELQALIRSEIESASEFVDDEVADDRADAQKFYRGDPMGDEQEGRSQVVSRDVRDAVRQVMPSLMRVFFGSERAVEFVPENAEDVPMAEQATDYVNYVILQDNPGFEVFHDAFKDALYQKAGVVKWWWDESVEVKSYKFTGLTDEQLGLLLQEEGVEAVAVNSQPDPDLVGAAVAAGIPAEAVPALHDVEIRRRIKLDRARIMAVPPEEFLINRNARSIDDARCVVHRCFKTVGELVALGYDYDEVLDYAGTEENFWRNRERYEREWAAHWPDSSNHDANRPVMYCEAYIHADYDGDGIAELRRVCTMGEQYEIVQNEPWNDKPFAAFCADPVPHTFFGYDLADQTKDIQRIKSALLRNILDSAALAIYPRTAIVEGMASIEDALNPEMGAIIRMRQPGMVQPFTTPFTGAQMFPVMEYLDQMKTQRVGVHNMALEADALQSTTKAAVNAQVDAARQQLEMIARLFAESGMKRVFRGILKLVTQHQDRSRTVRLTNEWVEVDPAVWNANMDVTVNVGLGTGLAEDRLQTLAMVAQRQEQILQLLGPSNPLVSMGQYANTLSKMIELAGWKDTGQFFNKLPLDFQPPQQPPKPDPNEILAQASLADIQARSANDQARIQLDREKLAMEDDRERDKLHIDLALKAAEIEAKYGTQLEIAELKANVDRLGNQGR